MGLLFRPRPPLMRMAASTTEGHDREARRDRLSRLRRAFPELGTVDASCWTPADSVASMQRRAREVADRCGAFSEVEIAATAAVVGDRGYVEWIFSCRHTGPLVVDDELVIAPTGEQMSIRGVTVAALTGDRICSIRRYWDEPTLLEAFGLLPQD